MNIAILDCAINQRATASIQKLSESVSQYCFDSYWILDPDDFLKLNNSKDKYHGYIILGSSSNVCDRFKWQSNLADFIKDELDRRKKVLGICFGHQLMADYFGGIIGKIVGDVPKKGIRNISFTKDFYSFKEKEKLPLIVYHSYHIQTLPKDFELLATSLECPHELVRHKYLPYIGIQAHPEADWNFVEQNKLNDLILKDNLNDIYINALLVLVPFFSH